MSNTLEDIREKLEIAIRTLLKQDSFLLENRANERAVSHKLAEYLQPLFPDYNVDCEYNRHGMNTKKLEGMRECRGSKDLVLPDILIHTRGIDDNNLVVIEIKTSTDDDSCDLKKLELFTTTRGGYKYAFGFFIRFNKINWPKIRVFRNDRAI